jgi:hypothetical protein
MMHGSTKLKREGYGTCTGQMRVVRKREGKRTLRRPRRRLEVIFKTFFEIFRL